MVHTLNEPLLVAFPDVPSAKASRGQARSPREGGLVGVLQRSRTRGLCMSIDHTERFMIGIG